MSTNVYFYWEGAYIKSIDKDPWPDQQKKVQVHQNKGVETKGDYHEVKANNFIFGSLKSLD